MKNYCISVLGLLLLTHISSFAQSVDLVQSRFAFDEGLLYDENIDTPAKYLDYELGEKFTIYEKVVGYFQYLSNHSEKIDLQQYGTSYEGKPLYNIVISSEDNLKNIDALQERHLSLLDAELTQEKKQEIIDNDPVVTSISYNIHGNEAASTEAVMQVAYCLSAAIDPAIEAVLEHSIIVIFICINPDGHDRYVNWINDVSKDLVGVSPSDLEHYAPWPSGRTNHYWFDLNRDWIWGVHPESRGHAAVYQNWMPQIHVDYHEQGYQANYFTAPGAKPRNLLLPDEYEQWSEVFGNANIEVFDKHALMYFTSDRFDFFYPGYGSSYPSVMGAIGMLTEQGGIGAGRAVETEDGYVLTLRQRVFDHYVTSLATIRTAAEKRKALLQYSLDSWNPEKSKSPTKAYILKNEENGYLKDLLNVLDRNKIEVHRAVEDFSLNALDYWSGETKEQAFDKGDYIVLADQARHLFIHSILSKNMAIEDSVMYDMSTWSAPMAYNLSAFASEKTPLVEMELMSEQDLTEKGVLIEDLSLAQKPYAYIIDWNQRWAPKALSLLWEKGYRVRAAAIPFSDGENQFSAGSLIVLRARNLEKASVLEKDLKTIADQSQCAIYALPTGRMAEGYDLASSRNRPLNKPRVAMLVEPPFSTYTSGQVYFLFDQETGLSLDRVRTTAFNQTSLPKFGQRYGYVDLNDYDVLILSGGGDHMKRLFWKDQLYQINQWLNRGGTLVCLESAAAYFTKDNQFGHVELKKQTADTSVEKNHIQYQEYEHYHGLRRIPGAALKASIDTTHPLAFGVKPQLFNLKFGTKALQPSENLQTVGSYDFNPNQLLAAGYASTENLNHLAGQSFSGVQKVGKGKVVYLLDNPHYRMFWRGAARMTQNAVMMLPAFD